MSNQQALLAEFLGTAGLLIVVVGSGIMGESLSQGNQALALLANSIVTGAGLFILIQTLGPISGAHFNPVVTLIDWLNREISIRQFFSYMVAQIGGAILGVLVTHLIFDLPIFQLSDHDRSAHHLLFSEVVATFGLVILIILSRCQRSSSVAATVALYITAAYWFTSSTSFANPAVTIARSFTNTFCGIHWPSVAGFIVSQFLGSICAWIFSKRLVKRRTAES